MAECQRCLTLAAKIMELEGDLAATRKGAWPDNLQIVLIKFGGLGYMAKVYAMTDRGGETGTLLYHGEYHKTAEEALRLAMVKA